MVHRRTLALSALFLMLTACGAAKSGSGLSIPRPNTKNMRMRAPSPGDEIANAYMLDNNNRACLNLKTIHDTLTQKDKAQVRVYTRYFRTTSTAPANKAQDLHMQVLFLKNDPPLYDVSPGAEIDKSKNFKNYLGFVKQNDCTKVTLELADGSAKEFDIVSISAAVTARRNTTARLGQAAQPQTVQAPSRSTGEITLRATGSKNETWILSLRRGFLEITIYQDPITLPDATPNCVPNPTGQVQKTLVFSWKNQDKADAVGIEGTLPKIFASLPKGDGAWIQQVQGRDAYKAKDPKTYRPNPAKITAIDYVSSRDQIAQLNTQSLPSCEDGPQPAATK